MEEIDSGMRDGLLRKVSRRSIMKTGIGAFAALSLGSLLAACGGDDDDDDSSSGTTTSGTGGSTPAAGNTPAPASTTSSGSAGSPTTVGSTGSVDFSKAKAGGKLTMSLSDSDATSFDPIIPTDNMSIWTMLLIYDQVVRISADGTGVEPGLAETWEASTDGKTYTFHLRDATFHDGTKVTSADVKYCLDRVTVDPLSQWSWILTAVDGIDAPDEKTVVARLKSTWVPYLSDISLYSCSIFPKAQHESKQAALFDNPVGSGPYKWVSWEKEQKITLTKNENYWTEGQPYINDLEFRVLTDANARMLQYQSGELDIATDVPFSQLDALKSDPNTQVITDAVARIDYIAINHLRFPDVKVRQAINYAVDKDAIIKNVLFGAGELATTMLPKMLYWNPDTKGYPYDVAKAKELIAQTDKKDGFEAELLVGTGDPVAAQVAQLVADNLKDIGGDITVTQLEAAARGARTKAHDFDLSKGYYTTDITDPDELIVFACVSTGGTEAVRTSYVNKDVDQWALDAETQTDAEQRKQTYYKIQQQTTDDAVVLLLYYPTGRTAVSKHIQNFHILPTGNYRLWETWRDDV